MHGDSSFLSMNTESATQSADDGDDDLSGVRPHTNGERGEQRKRREREEASHASAPLPRPHGVVLARLEAI